jgi:hypothetical protein
MVLEASAKQNHDSKKREVRSGVFKAVKTVALLLAIPSLREKGTTETCPYE